MSDDPIRSLIARPRSPAHLAAEVARLLDASLPSARGPFVPLLPELLHALGEAAEAADFDTAATLMDAVRRVARAGPVVSRSLITEALLVGTPDVAWPDLVTLLESLGADLDALAREHLHTATFGEFHESVRSLSLLCALAHRVPSVELGRALLTLPGGKHWRLEDRRAAALAVVPGMMDDLRAALGRGDAIRRARAEAALMLMGDDAAEAAWELLRMPKANDERNETDCTPIPSPVLYRLGARILPVLAQAMTYASDIINRRAMFVLSSIKDEEPEALDALISGLTVAEASTFGQTLEALKFQDGDGNAVPLPDFARGAFARALRHEAPTVRLGAAASLAFAEPHFPGLESIFVEAFDGMSPRLRLTAIHGMALLDPPPVALVVGMFDSDDEMIWPLCRNLGTRHALPAEIVEAMVRTAFRHPERKHFEPFVEAFARTGSAGASALVRRYVELSRERKGQHRLELAVAVSRYLPDFGRDGLVAAWLHLDEHSGGADLPYHEAAMFYRILCRCGGTDEVIDAFRSHPVAEVRAAALHAMDHAPDELFPAALSALADDSPLVRKVAATVCARGWFRESLPDDLRRRLVESTLDRFARYDIERPPIRDLVEEGEAVLRLRPVLQHVRDTARGGNAATCLAAVSVIERLSPAHDPAALHAVHAILDDMSAHDDAAVRAAATKARQRFRDVE